MLRNGLHPFVMPSILALKQEKEYVEGHSIVFVNYIYLHNTSRHFKLYLCLEVKQITKLSSHVPNKNMFCSLLPSAY